MHFLLSVCFLVTTSASLSIMDFYRPFNGLGKDEMRAVDKEKMAALMNTSIDPCDDFFEYACGGWRDIPDFMDSDSVFINRTEQLFESPGSFFKAEMPGSAQEFYQKCLLEFPKTADLILEEATRLKDWMMEEAEHGDFDLWKIVANLSKMGVETLVKIGAGSDEDGVFWLIKMENEPVLNKTFTDGLKDPPAVPAYPEELPDLVETIDLRSYLSIRFEENITRKVYVANPARLNEFGEFLSRQNTSDLINYLYDQILLNFLEKYTGSMGNCALFAEEMFRYQILLAIAEEDFPPEIQNDVMDLANRIQREQLKIFGSVRWFDAHTRAEALRKARVVQKRLAVNTTYTADECFTDIYEGFEMTQENYVKLMLSYDIGNKLKKCIQNVEFFFFLYGVMSINAAFFIGGGFNMFILPGILLPPFYSYEFPNFKKYSGLGVAIGHEYMHNFDSKNIKKDSTGAKVDWWSPRFSNKLTRQYECAYTHYNKQYNIDGLLTIRENVPDIVGLKIAYDAYKNWLEETNTTAEQEMQGFEELGLNIDQLFFVNFAQSICLLANGRINATSSEGDTHSPPAFRVRGAVANFQDFAEAFQCPVGAAMNPRRKCEYFV